MIFRTIRLREYARLGNGALGAPLVAMIAAAASCSGAGSPTGLSGAARSGTPSARAIHVFAKKADGSATRLDLSAATEAHFGLASNASATSEGDGGTPVTSPPSVDAPGIDPWSTAWALVWRASLQCGYDQGAPSIPPWTVPRLSDPTSPSWYIYRTAIPSDLDCAGRLQLEQNLVCIADSLGAIADAVGPVVWPAIPSGGGGAPTSYSVGADPSLTEAEWDIPPQADADRFIVRDLAIHTLAMLPTLDAFTDLRFPTADGGAMSSLPSPSTCAQAFAWLANPANTGGPAGGCISDTISAPVLGGGGSSWTPVFPPTSVPICDAEGNNNAPAIAATAIDIEAQILRSSGRLLHDLIRRDVYSDLAAAAQQAAQALDPVAGNVNAWGIANDASYGTISHAARVLAGRWELGDQSDFGNVADPQCEGVSELNLLPGALGSDFLVRPQDREIRTAGEQTAVQLVERSGLVVPSSAMGDATALGKALRSQLLLEEQVQNNLPTPPQATALNEVLASVADADLVFAFQRALRTWKLLTNTSEPTTADAGATTCSGQSPLELSPGTLPAGLVMATYPASWPSGAGQPLIADTSVCGIVVKGGLSRSRLSTDPIARAGGMLEASQCVDGTDYWSEWGGDGTAVFAARGSVGSGGVGLPPTAALPPIVFQDAFHIGQALERRLNVLQLASAGIAQPVAALSDALSQARGGIAELRSWAGATIVHAWPVPVASGSNEEWSSFTVRVGGMSYARDFGISPAASAATIQSTVQSAFGFVYGPPWMAECAAGVRADCPASSAQAGTAQDVTGGIDEQSTVPFASTGVLDNIFELNVPLTAGAFGGNPPPVLDPSSATAPGESHLYMILLHDPTNVAGHGRVLGTIALRGSWQKTIILNPATPTSLVTDFLDAPMQRELVHDAIDLGSWVGARPPVIGGASAAEASGYCVDGVPRDLFVPLDNELIAGTQTYEDSWQAYLALAQTAAQTADALGQQLIANDLQISQNQQAAEEQLANICGDFGALSTATVATDGHITADPEDPTTQACLGESSSGQAQTVDVVFLGKMPSTITAAPTDPGFTAQLQAAINCNSGAASGGPSTASALCAKPQLTAAALNIGSADAGAPASGGLLSAPCADLLNKAAPTIRTGLNAQEYLTDLQDPSQAPSSIQNVVSQLQMLVGLDNHWQVKYGTNAVIMDSQDPEYWPACINRGCSPSVSQVSPVTAVMAPGWSTLFRNCDARSAAEDSLGNCDGGGNPAVELNMLKWRVTQAMWMLAASSGVLPAGMVTQPIPGIFTDSAPSAPCKDLDCSTVALQYFPTGTASYYTGRLTAQISCDASPSCCSGAGTACQSLDDTDPTLKTGDAPLVGSVFPINAAFGYFGSDSNVSGNGNGEVPYWYSFLYSSQVINGSPSISGASHFLVANAPAIFSQCNSGYGGAANPFPPPGGCQLTGAAGAGVPTPSTVPIASLVGGATGLDGIECQQNYGPSSNKLSPTFGGAAPWWTVVGAVKQGVMQQSVTANPFEWTNEWQLPASTSDFVSWDESFSTMAMAGSVPVGTWSQWWAPGIGVHFGQYQRLNYSLELGALSPTQWPPSSRALAFMGYGATPNGTCGAATLLLQASALACTPSPSTTDLATANLGGPPVVSTLADVPVLEAWLTKTSALLQSTAGSFYLQEVPQQVVQDFQNGTVGSGAIGGTRGQAILTMEQQIQQLPTSWSAMASALKSISDDVAIANGSIVGAGLNMKTADGALAFQTIETQANMALSVANFLETVSAAAGNAFSSEGGSLAVIPAAVLALVDSLSYGNQELAQIQSEANTATQVEQNQLYQALAQLSANTGPLWNTVQTEVDNLRGAIAQIDSSGQAIQLAQNQAAYQLAVGTGSDFVSVAGQEVPIPVDTVLRRQSSATLQRYQAALTNAKALAYMARRAIEQRIGVPLDALTEQVGPVNAPASWADNICSLQGVNYASLSAAVPAGDDGGGIDGAVDQSAISQFADAWVGDYVAELQNFVTYYNVQYPSHQGEDLAVLSLRYDLLGPTAQCTTQAPNMLTNSGDLSQLGGSSWQLAPCNQLFQKCLAVVGGYALPPPLSGPWADQGFDEEDAGAALAAPGASGVTWLVDVAEPQTLDAGPARDAGADGGSASEDASATLPPSPLAAWPNNVVGQQVQLAAGSYVLSWWDQARDASGNVLWAGTLTAPQTAPSYLAEVLDPTWNTAAVFDAPPFTPPQVGEAGAPSLWSARNSLSFTVETDGIYTIAFAASALASAPGSVAIAAVQLEQASSGQPSTYVATTGTTMVAGLDCPMSDSDLRSAFTHTCDSNGACHYDLTVPFVVDTSALDGSPLSGKLAGGNYNYRQITTALNLVGTGVHSCVNDPTQNCYGSGYVQYNLQHDAQNAGIVGYDGNSRVFDFGVANISGGKALAAEQYITMPLSSNDQQLISQPGIEHVEFGGRPVDGTYYLRIWDSPDLNWSALQDIQLILDYEYWSQIQVPTDQMKGAHPQLLKRAPIKPRIKRRTVRR